MSSRRPDEDEAAEWTAEWRMTDDDDPYDDEPTADADRGPVTEWPEVPAESQPADRSDQHGRQSGLLTQDWPEMPPEPKPHTPAWIAPSSDSAPAWASDMLDVPMEPVEPPAAEAQGSSAPDWPAPPPGDRLVYSSRQAAEKAAQTPTAPAEEPLTTVTERTGFLGSGWSGDDGDDDGRGDASRGDASRDDGGRGDAGRGDGPADRPAPAWDGDEEERAPRKRMRTTLLSVAAAVAVLGGTAAGVQVMSQPTSTVKPAAAAAAEKGAGQPFSAPESTPEASDTPEDEPSEEPRARKSAREETRPEAEATSPAPQPTRENRPSASPTRKPKPRAELDDRSNPPPDIRETEEPEPEDDLEQQPPPPVPQPVLPQQTQAPTPSQTPQSPDDDGKGGILDNVLRVGFDVQKKGLLGYRATVSVDNPSKVGISGLTMSLPVSGRVSDVDGADWDQDGGTLTLRYAGAVGAGDKLTIRIEAIGEVKSPSACQASGAKCEVGG